MQTDISKYFDVARKQRQADQKTQKLEGLISEKAEQEARQKLAETYRNTMKKKVEDDLDSLLYVRRSYGKSTGAVDQFGADWLTDQVISTYASYPSIDGDREAAEMRYNIDSAISFAFDRPLTDVMKNHKALTTGIMGRDVEDKTFWNALMDSASTVSSQRKIARYNKQWLNSDDPNVQAQYLKKIEEEKKNLVKLGDYTSRGLVPSLAIKTAPISRQILESMAVTLGTSALINIVGGAVAGLNASTFTKAHSLKRLMKQGEALKLWDKSKHVNQLGAAIKGLTANADTIKNVGRIARHEKIARLGLNLVDNYVPGTLGELSMLGGKVASGFFNTYTVAKGLAIDDMRETGIAKEEIDKWSELSAIAETAIEYMTFDPILGHFFRGNGVKNLSRSVVKKLADAGADWLKGSASETLEEVLQEVSGMVFKNMAIESSNVKYGTDIVPEKNYLDRMISTASEVFAPMLLAGFGGTAIKFAIDIPTVITQQDQIVIGDKTFQNTGRNRYVDVLDLPTTPVEERNALEKAIDAGVIQEVVEQQSDNKAQSVEEKKTEATEDTEEIEDTEKTEVEEEAEKAETPSEAEGPENLLYDNDALDVDETTIVKENGEIDSDKVEQLKLQNLTVTQKEDKKTGKPYETARPTDVIRTFETPDGKKYAQIKPFDTVLVVETTNGKLRYAREQDALTVALAKISGIPVASIKVVDKSEYRISGGTGIKRSASKAFQSFVNESIVEEDGKKFWYPKTESEFRSVTELVLESPDVYEWYYDDDTSDFIVKYIAKGGTQTFRISPERINRKYAQIRRTEQKVRDSLSRSIYGQMNKNRKLKDQYTNAGFDTKKISDTAGMFLAVASESLGIPMQDLVGKDARINVVLKTDIGKVEDTEAGKIYRPANAAVDIEKDAEGKRTFTINLTPTANEETIVHEIAHIIRMILPQEYLDAFTEQYGTYGKVWIDDIVEIDGRYYLGDTDRSFDTKLQAVEEVRRNEERFAEDFVKYIVHNESPSEQLSRVFNALHESLKAVLAEEMNNNEPLSDSLTDLFNRLIANEARKYDREAFATRLYEIEERNGEKAKELKELDDEYFRAIKDNDVAKIAQMVEARANEMGFKDAFTEQGDGYSIRTKPAPKKTIKVYKTFTVDENGIPTALFVNSGIPLPMGIWLDAHDTYHFAVTKKVRGKLVTNWYVPSTKNPNTEGGATGTTIHLENNPKLKAELVDKGYISKSSNTITALAYRPGWHAGDMPFFPQGGMRDVLYFAQEEEYKDLWKAIQEESRHWDEKTQSYKTISDDTAKKRLSKKVGNYDTWRRNKYPEAYKEAPYANVHRYNQVVFECEMSLDNDYTRGEVVAKGENKGMYSYKDMQSMPVDGSYKFSTNPMAKATDIGTWYIGGTLKINRALSESEVNEILQKNNFEPQAWQSGKKSKETGPLDLNKLNVSTEEIMDGTKKTLAPITYDENGNIIPLSKRFDATSSNVLYEMKEEKKETKKAKKARLKQDIIDYFELFESLGGDIDINDLDVRKMLKNAYDTGRELDKLDPSWRTREGGRYGAMFAEILANTPSDAFNEVSWHEVNTIQDINNVYSDIMKSIDENQNNIGYTPSMSELWSFLGGNMYVTDQVLKDLLAQNERNPESRNYLNTKYGLKGELDDRKYIRENNLIHKAQKYTDRQKFIDDMVEELNLEPDSPTKLIEKAWDYAQYPTPEEMKLSFIKKYATREGVRFLKKKLMDYDRKTGSKKDEDARHVSTGNVEIKKVLSLLDGVEQPEQIELVEKQIMKHIANNPIIWQRALWSAENGIDNESSFKSFFNSIPTSEQYKYYLLSYNNDYQFADIAKEKEKLEPLEKDVEDIFDELSSVVDVLPYKMDATSYDLITKDKEWLDLKKKKDEQIEAIRQKENEINKQLKAEKKEAVKLTKEEKDRKYKKEIEDLKFISGVKLEKLKKEFKETLLSAEKAKGAMRGRLAKEAKDNLSRKVDELVAEHLEREKRTSIRLSRKLGKTQELRKRDQYEAWWKEMLMAQEYKDHIKQAVHDEVLISMWKQAKKFHEKEKVRRRDFLYYYNKRWKKEKALKYEKIEELKKKKKEALDALRKRLNFFREKEINELIETYQIRELKMEDFYKRKLQELKEHKDEVLANYKERTSERIAKLYDEIRQKNLEKRNQEAYYKDRERRSRLDDSFQKMSRYDKTRMDAKFINDIQFIALAQGFTPVPAVTLSNGLLLHSEEETPNHIVGADNYVTNNPAEEDAIKFTDSMKTSVEKAEEAFVYAKAKKILNSKSKTEYMTNLKRMIEAMSFEQRRDYFLGKNRLVVQLNRESAKKRREDILSRKYGDKTSKGLITLQQDIQSMSEEEGIETIIKRSRQEISDLMESKYDPKKYDIEMKTNPSSTVEILESLKNAKLEQRKAMWDNLISTDHLAIIMKAVKEQRRAAMKQLADKRAELKGDTFGYLDNIMSSILGEENQITDADLENAFNAKFAEKIASDEDFTFDSYINATDVNELNRDDTSLSRRNGLKIYLANNPELIFGAKSKPDSKAKALFDTYMEQWMKPQAVSKAIDYMDEQSREKGKYFGEFSKFFTKKPYELKQKQEREIRLRLEEGGRKFREIFGVEFSERNTKAGFGEKYELDLSSDKRPEVTNSVVLTKAELIGIYVYYQQGKTSKAVSKMTNASGNDLPLSFIENVAESDVYLTEQDKAWGDYLIESVGQKTDELYELYYELDNEVFIRVDNYFPFHSKEIIKKIAPEGVATGESGKYGVAESFAQLRTDEMYPLSLDVTNIWISTIEEQEHALAFKKWGMQAKDLLENQGLYNFIKGSDEKRGTRYADATRDYVQRILRQPNTLNDIERQWNKVLSNMAVARISGSLMTTLRQFISFIPGLLGTGTSWRYVSKAIGEWMHGFNIRSLSPLSGEKFSNPFFEEIFDKDEIMRNRTLDLEVKQREALKLYGKTSVKMDKVNNFLMHWIKSADTFTAGIVWKSAYYKAIDEGRSEQDAVYYAGQTVLETQSSSEDLALAKLQTEKSPFWRFALMFTNDLFLLWNAVYMDAPTEFRRMNRDAALSGKRDWGPFANKMFASALVLMMSAISQAGFLPDDDDDDEMFFQWGDFFRDIEEEAWQSFFPVGGKYVAEKMRGFGSEMFPLVADVVKLRNRAFKEDTSASKRVNDILDVGTSILELYGYPSNLIDKLRNVFYNKREEEFQLDLGFLLNTNCGYFDFN